MNMEAIADDDFPEAEEKSFSYSETITKAKIFPTEAEAKAWRDAEKAIAEKAGLTCFERSDDSPWDLPPYEKITEGRWVAYFEAELIVWEDNETTQ